MKDPLVDSISSSSLFEEHLTLDGEMFGRDEEVVVPNVLYLTIHGSRLQGTATEDSDYDYKGVFAAPFDQKVLDRSDRTIDLESQDDEIEIDFVELRKFADDLLSNQPYSLEVLHSNCDRFSDCTSHLWDRLVENRDLFKSNNIHPFRGYGYQMAKTYGEKGKRYEAFKHVLDVLEEEGGDDRLRDHVDRIDRSMEYIEVSEKEINGGDVITYLEVATREYEFNTPVEKVVESVRTNVDKYGDRVTEQGVIDWKAFSHARRMIDECEEYLKTGQLSFPLEHCDRLLDIKQGQVDPDECRRRLQEDLERMKEFQEHSDLPDQPDKEGARSLIVDIYSSIYDRRKR